MVLFGACFSGGFCGQSAYVVQALTKMKCRPFLLASAAVLAGAMYRNCIGTQCFRAVLFGRRFWGLAVG